MAIVIKKRVELDFLGEDYKGAFLVFQSIPVADLEKVTAEVKKAEAKGESTTTAILDMLKSYYISGQFPEDGELKDQTKEDLDGLDPETTIACFKAFTGQKLDPKVETPSMTISPTVESPQSSS